MVERTSIHQPAASFKRKKLVLTTSSSALALTAFAFAALFVTPLTVSEVQAQTVATSQVTPISEDDFINPTGLGILASAVAQPYEIETTASSAVNFAAAAASSAGSSSGFLENAMTDLGGATDMAGLDETIPGMHTPALPASMNPALQSDAASVSVSSTTSPLASPLPSAFIDTDVQSVNEFQSASLQAGRVEPSSDVVINDDLSIPPAAMANELPNPFPSAIATSSARVNVPTVSSTPRASGAKDLAFMVKKLDSVGINSQKMRGRIGTGLIARPDYIGSNESEFDMIPVIDLEYMDRVFLSTERGVGVKVFKGERFDASAFGTWRRGRSAEGDIKTFSDRDGSIAMGVELGTSYGPFRLSLNTDYGLTGDTKGAKSDLDLNYSQAIGSKLNAKIGLGVRAADSTYMNSLFGVSASDISTAAPSITQNEDFSAGLLDVHTGVKAAYFFTPNISLNLGLNGSILTGDAANSQIVESLGSKTQWNSTISTQFKF